MTTITSILDRSMSWKEELGGLSSTGLQSGTQLSDWACRWLKNRNAFLTVLLTGKSSGLDPTWSGSKAISLLGLQVLRKPLFLASSLLIVFSSGKERKAENEKTGFFFMWGKLSHHGASSSLAHLNLLTSQKFHLQIPSLWGLGFQHMNLGWGTLSPKQILNLWQLFCCFFTV